MKSISFAKVITLGCFALLLPVACGDDDDGGPGPGGGTAGVAGESTVGGGGAGAEGGAPPTVMIPGTSPMSETRECGTTECSSTPTLLPTLFIDPCCTTANSCGVDSGFLSLLQVNLNGACLPKDQPGELDEACPDSEGATVPFGSTNVEVEPFKGCCRPNGTCGFLVNDIDTSAGQFTSPELGCVDSAAFGAPMTACGDAVGGAGGGGAGGAAGGAGGEPAVVGGGGAGGAP